MIQNSGTHGAVGLFKTFINKIVNMPVLLSLLIVPKREEIKDPGRHVNIKNQLVKSETLAFFIRIHSGEHM